MSAGERAKLRFDDLEGLAAQVGESFGDWGPEVAVSQEMIDQFADLTGDDNWLHTDPERCARESPYGRPIAHGLLVLSLIPRLRTPMNFEVTGFSVMVNYGSDRLRFTGAVPAGSLIHGRCRLKQVRRTGPATLINLENQVHVVGEDSPAMIYELLIRYQ